MNKLLVFTLLFMVLGACSVAPPPLPTSSPTLAANATDTDGTIRRVDFYNYSSLIGSVTNYPFSMVYSNQSGGTSLSLIAQATANMGASTYSAPVLVTNCPGSIPSSCTSSTLQAGAQVELVSASQIVPSGRTVKAMEFTPSAILS